MLLLIGIVISTGISGVESDCAYSFHSDGFNDCTHLRDYKFIRRINCINGHVYHVCCTPPLRPDIQASRQNWFRSVTAVGDRISRECTKSILCRMSCQDSLVRGPRPDYPQVLPLDTIQNQEYVDAVNSGERTCQFKGLRISNSTSVCERECGDMYALCGNEIRESVLISLYDTTAETFHTIGMLAFDVWWWFLDNVT